MSNFPISIIGGGLAGLTCAKYLLDKNLKVVVYERAPQLGGRTSSWIEDGMHVESGLHRFLKFYTLLPKLIEECGQSMVDVVEWLDEIGILLPKKDSKLNETIFATSPLSKPFDLLLDTLGNNDFISVTEKLKFSLFFSNGLKDYFTNPKELDNKTLEEYAKENHVEQKTIDNLLTALSDGIFFIPPKDFSAFAFFSTVGPYLKNIHNLGEGAFKGGMTDVMINPIVKYIKKKGGEIITNSTVKHISIEPSVAYIHINDKVFPSSHIVIATEIGAAQKIIKESLTREVIEKSNSLINLMELQTHPASTIQFELSKPSMNSDRPYFTPGTLISSFAEQSRTTFKSSKGRLSMIMSQPNKFIQFEDNQIYEIALKESSKLGINLKNVINYKVVNHPTEFYLMSPGSEKLRPHQNTGIPKLFLAGDYTKQKYISTMEGAVQSGILAAEEILKSIA